MKNITTTFGDIEIKKQKLHQHKSPISIKNIDKIVVSSKVSFGKKGFIYFIGYKDAKKNRPLYTYFSQKCVHIEETLIKLNIYLF